MISDRVCIIISLSLFVQIFIALEADWQMSMTTGRSRKHVRQVDTDGGTVRIRGETNFLVRKGRGLKILLVAGMRTV